MREMNILKLDHINLRALKRELDAEYRIADENRRAYLAAQVAAVEAEISAARIRLRSFR